MKKLIYNDYGNTSVLQWEETTVPEVKDNEVLVQVKAAGINPTDTKIRNGEMKMITMFMGSFPRGMGLDFAGTVTAVGSDVTTVKVGDNVYGGTGMSGGSFADFVAVEAKDVHPMPAGLGFAEASTLTLNGGTAIATVNNYMEIEPGKKVLVNGASGGVGLFIMQISKAKGAHVTAVGAAESVAKLLELGADEAIDYKTTNVLTAGKLYDVILDASGHMKFDDAKDILTEHGVYCTLTPSLSSMAEQMGNLFRGKKEKNVLARPSKEDMAELVSLVTAGKVKCVVGKTYPMADAITAQKDVEEGKLKITGKVVLVA